MVLGEAGTDTGADRLQGGSSLRHHSTAPLCFSGGSGFLHKHPNCRASPSLPSPQDVSSCPTALFCLGLLSEPHVPAPRSCLNQRTPYQAGWAGQGSVPCVQVSLCPACWLPSSLPTENEVPFCPN